MQVGKYELIGQLAVGGMAEVFLARTSGPMGFEKQLVLKRVLPHLALDPSFVQMFLGEATLAARLTHPNIVQIFDFGETDGAYYLAMEYIDGPSLRKLLDDSLARGGPLPPPLCARIISAACEGLAFAHDFQDPTTGKPLDIVHRDISPDNILLSRQGAVKVVDFGIAKAAGQQHRTQTGMIKGKLAYMPPEQIRNQPLDRRVDVYALGIVFYELLTGQRPFQADTDVSLMHTILFDAPKPAGQLQPLLPEPVQRIIQRAIAKDRDQRFSDCLAFQAALEEYLLSTGKPVTTGHVAQLIAQISPPSQQAPTLPQLPSHGLITDTLIRHAPDALPVQTGVDLSPSPIAEPHAPPIVGAQPVAPPQREKMRRAAMAGALLLVAGGGYLLSHKPGPPQPVPMTPIVAPAPSPTLPEQPTPSPREAQAPTPPSPLPKTPAPANPPPEETPVRSNAKTGILELEVTPPCIVYLEGKKLGWAPPLGVLDINPGTYRLKFFNKRLRKTEERTVEVKAGRTTFVQMDMLREEAQKSPEPPPTPRR